jgi:quercetin dioxygenase-like cupin family protein
MKVAFQRRFANDARMPMLPEKDGVRVAHAKIRRVVIALAIMTSATPLPIRPAPVASATPSAGVEAVDLSASTVDGHDYITRELTIEPGGSTGWHWHQGHVYGVIEAGTLTHNRADCSVDGVYHTGDAIDEGSGPDQVHIGRNLESTPLVMQVRYVDAAGSPLAEDAPDPGCGFA